MDSVDLASASLAALDHVTDAVIILDARPCVVHANAAAALLTGLGVQTLRDMDPLEILGTEDPLSVRQAAWRALTQGHPASGRMSIPHADGARAELEVTISPVRDRQGIVSHYIALLTDATSRRRMDADRIDLLSLMARVRPASTVEETSAALCREVAQMDGIDGAMILLLPPEGDLVHVTSVGPPIPGFEYGTPIPLEQLEQLVATTSTGAWYLDLMHPAARAIVGSDLVDLMLRQGITATAYAAMRAEGLVTGVLSVASTAPDGAERFAARLSTLEQLGGLAGTVLGNQAVQFGHLESLRRGLRDVIENTRFHAVFQPIVRLADAAVMGYEALTRFDDGKAPDVHFREARSVGLAIDLEDACVKLALGSAARLPPGIPLSVNFSPEAIVSGSIGRALSLADRPIIVEITEHAVIGSYQAVRSAIVQHGVEASVDDAGAGFASLRHILELRPHYVKLDIGLVRDIDADPARAAMVAGMCHFARATGTRLVAEGIESQAEAEALAELGVELGQGYFFGRPAPV